MYPRLNSIALKHTLTSDWNGVWYVDREHMQGAFSASYNEYTGLARVSSEKPWPIVLHSLAAVHLDTNNLRVNGSIFALVALVDKSTPLVLLRDVQSPWNTITWTGYLPLTVGFGVSFDTLGPVNTDKLVLTATYSHRKGYDV